MSAVDLSTALPDASERLVWGYSINQVGRVVVLTSTALVTAPVAADVLAELTGSLRGGGPIDMIPSPRCVDFIQITRIDLDLVENVLTIEHLEADHPELTCLGFSGEEGDQIFAALHERLGLGYRLEAVRPKVWTAARVPVKLLAWG